MKPDPSHEIALQDEWLRRVARALVQDTDLAQDLVQDAWVASLRRGRLGETERPWLSGVVRNSAFALHGDTARPRAHPTVSVASSVR